MSRYILLAALGMALAGGQATASPHDGACDGHCGRYGWHPLLKIRNWFKKDACDAGCGKLGCKRGCGPLAGYGGYAPPGIGYPGTPGADMPGTLVFPNHPFARSPRDFFMYEPK